MYLWRVAAETPEWEAHELSGRDVEEKGGRWSLPGTPLVYACTTIGIACLETLVHLAPGEIPANRYLVRISVSPGLWASRSRCQPEPGWDAEPPGRVSQAWGMRWIEGCSSLLASVPSVIAPEENNVLINPRHPDARHISATRLRRWTYDLRLFAGPVRPASPPSDRTPPPLPRKQGNPGRSRP